MFSKCAAIVLAVLLHVTSVQAEPFDPSIYHGERAFEFLVTGELTQILQADDDTRNTITLYAMGVAGKLQFLWKDQLSPEFGMLALVKVATVSQVLGLDDEGLNNLLSLGAQDASAFAGHHPFGSEPARNLLANLSLLMSQ